MSKHKFWGNTSSDEIKLGQTQIGTKHNMWQHTHYEKRKLGRSKKIA